MNPSQLFGIVIRMLGLTLTIYVAGGLAFGLEDMPEDEIRYYITAVGLLILGLYLLRGAPALVRFSYPVSNDGLKIEDI